MVGIIDGHVRVTGFFEKTTDELLEERLVLDEHNIEYDILWRTTAAERPSFRKLYNRLNYVKLSREESAAWQQFDGVIHTSVRDQALLIRAAPAKRTAVIPTEVYTTPFRPT